MTTDETESAGVLWEVSAKLRGLSETLLQANGEMPYSEIGLTGLSYILLGIANQVEKARDDLDRRPEVSNDEV